MSEFLEFRKCKSPSTRNTHKALSPDNKPEFLTMFKAEPSANGRGPSRGVEGVCALLAYAPATAADAWGK